MIKKLQEMDLVTKMSIIGAIVVLFIIVAVVMIALSGSEPAVVLPNVPGNAVNGGLEPDAVEYVGDREYVRMIGVISYLDTANRTLHVTNVETSEKVVLRVPTAIRIVDAYGTLITLNELRIGEMIESKYDRISNTPDTLQVSNQGWTRSRVTNLRINEEEQTITIFNDTYAYTEDLVIYFGDQAVSLKDIQPSDELVVKGYQNHVWSISLRAKQGHIRLVGASSFIGGMIEVAKTYTVITENTVVTVPAGIQQVIITKDGFEPYVVTVEVFEDQEVEIDLSTVQAEVGSVRFKVVQSDATLYVNGERVSNYADPVNLNYGSYDVTVDAPGYATWRSTLLVNAPYQEFEIDLDARELMIQVDTPEGAELYINDVLIGEVPLTAPVSPGTHTLTLKRKGYFSRNHNISVDGLQGTFEFSFPELSEDPSYLGEEETIYVHTPEEADIYFNSSYIGTIPVSIQALAGTHTITIRREGHNHAMYSVPVVSGEGPYHFSYPELTRITAEPEPIEPEPIEPDEPIEEEEPSSNND